MAEKVLGFEGGNAGDNVTAGAGNVSGLNSVTLNGGTVKYDADAFAGSLSIAVTNVIGSNALVREYIDPPGTTAVTTTLKMSEGLCVQLPATLPTETGGECFWQLRQLPSSGGPRLHLWTDGGVRFQPNASAATVQVLTSAQRAALSGRWLRFTFRADAASPRTMTAADLTLKLYDLSGTLLNTYTVTADIKDTSSATGMAGMEFGRVLGTARVSTYKFDHASVSPDSLVEAGPPSTRIATPVVTLNILANPASLTGTEGIVEMIWAPVGGANRYDAYRTEVSGAPAEGDWVLYASGVTSPFEFTGQRAGTFWYGVRAVV